MNGEGGSYIIDEKGNRVLVERTQDARQAQPDADQKTQKTKGVKDA